jgi:hypothetical protein
VRVRIAVYIVAGAYAAGFFIYGITLPNTLSRALSFIPAGVAILFALFDNFLWRLWLVPNLIKRPVLLGTWHGTLHSYRRNSSGEPIQSDHDIYIIIRQNYSSISLDMISAESKSRSGAAQIVAQHDDEFTVQYQYRNDPKLEFRELGSSIHTGGSSIEVGGIRPLELDGEYWTARETRGTYHLVKVGSKRVSTYTEAERLKAAGI